MLAGRIALVGGVRLRGPPLPTRPAGGAPRPTTPRCSWPTPPWAPAASRPPASREAGGETMVTTVTYIIDSYSEQAQKLKQAQI